MRSWQAACCCTDGPVACSDSRGATQSSLPAHWDRNVGKWSIVACLPRNCARMHIPLHDSSLSLSLYINIYIWRRKKALRQESTAGWCKEFASCWFCLFYCSSVTVVIEQAHLLLNPRGVFQCQVDVHMFACIVCALHSS